MKVAAREIFRKRELFEKSAGEVGYIFCSHSFSRVAQTLFLNECLLIRVRKEAGEKFNLGIELFLRAGMLEVSREIIETT